LTLATRNKEHEEMGNAISCIVDPFSLLRNLASLNESQLHSVMRLDKPREQCERCLRETMLESHPPSLLRDLLPFLCTAPKLGTSPALKNAVNRVPPSHLFPMLAKLEIWMVSRLFGPNEWGFLASKLSLMSVTERVMALLWLPEWRNALLATVNPYTVLGEAEEAWAVRYMRELLHPNNLNTSLVLHCLAGLDPPSVLCDARHFAKLRSLLAQRGVSQTALGALHTVDDLRRFGSKSGLLCASELAPTQAELASQPRPIVAEACWQECLGKERLAPCLSDWLNRADAVMTRALMRAMGREERQIFVDLLVAGGATTRELLAEVYGEEPGMVLVQAPGDQVFRCRYSHQDDDDDDEDCSHDDE